MKDETTQTDLALLHDAYASEYDEQMRAYECYLADALFGLCFEHLRPGENLFDLGIGSGLSAIPFAKAELSVYGMDFSPAMLELCRAKDIAVELKQHDLLQTPWPYPASQFDHLVCCGVLHFISDLDAIFSEAKRVMRNNGIFAFTTKVPATSHPEHHKYDHQTVGTFDIFAHHTEYLQNVLEHTHFKPLKQLKCYVGFELFNLYVTKPLP